MLFGSTEQRGTFTSAHIGRIFVSKIGGGRGGGGGGGGGGGHCQGLFIFGILFLL